MGRGNADRAAGSPVARNAILVDTGFLVALFDTREKLHAAAQDWLLRLREPLWTVPSVLVEASHFLPIGQRVALARRAAGAAIRVATPDATAYLRVATLLQRYADQDPDWTDAELIWLAEVAGIHRIATVDTADFGVYRIHGRRAFDIVWPPGAA